MTTENKRNKLDGSISEHRCALHIKCYSVMFHDHISSQPNHADRNRDYGVQTLDH